MGLLRQTLILPEYITRLTALPAGLLAAGSKGNALEKAVAGTQKLVTVPGEICKSAQNFYGVSTDFDTLTAKAFTMKYGTDVANTLIVNAQGAIDYVKQFGENISENPIETFTAAGIAAGTIYAISRTIKFVRQKGRGSILDRFERKMGTKVWPGR